MLPPWSGDEVPYSWPTLQLPATQMGNSDGLYKRLSFFQECLAGPLPHAAKQHKQFRQLNMGTVELKTN